MRVLKVYSDGDYGALAFENVWSGTAVKDILDNIDNYKQDVEEDYEAEFLLETYDFGEIDKEFVKFIKDDIIDYDDSKHKTFYLETEIV